jgi:tripartite ATP-independent transporter DctM subunit
MGHVAVAANMIMAGISGSALADTAATGSILIPQMEKQGIERPFASAVIVASGTIGPMIPPSIFFIIYGGLGNVSILKLFLAGAIPGVLMGLFFMVVIYLRARRRNYPVQPRASVRAVLRSVRGGMPAILMPIVVIGGVFTATEAGAIAVFYALFLGLVTRRLALHAIWDALSKTAVTVSSILIVLSMANLVSYIANRTQVPHTISALLLGISTNPWVALLVVNLFLLLLGCFEAVIPTMIVATPILVPALAKIGVDPVHFGVVMTLNLLIGLMTPPFGASLFLVSSIAKVNMRELIVATWPFIVALLILLALITYVPQIVLFLPNALS